MPLILLAEEETVTIDHVRSALASQGWLVKTVGTRDQALRAASEFAPQLVLVNDRLLGVEDLVRTFSKRSGGPGVVLLTANNGDGGDLAAESGDVEAVLAKPLDTAQLIDAIRHGLADGKSKPTAIKTTDNDKVFSSEEIFGDLLDDILDPGEAPASTAAVSTAKPPSVAGSDRPSAAVRSAEATAEAADEAKSIPTGQVVPPAPAAPVIDIAEPPAVTVAAESSTELEADSASGLEDLEEVVRQEVAAWADTVQPEAGFIVAEADDLAALQDDVRKASEVAASDAQPEVPEEDLESKLEDTLAGVLAASLSSAQTGESPAGPEATASDSVDALLSQALGELDLASSSSSIAADEFEESPFDDELAALAASLEIKPRSPAVGHRARQGEEAETELELDQEPTEVEVDPAPTGAESAEALGDLDIDPVVEPRSDSTSLPARAAQGIEFGEYTLEQQIGVGGMASVWKARRKGVEGFEKRVAIKKILPQAAENEDFVEMFIDEAKLAAQLNHNNITHIYDLGKIGDDYFIAMEFVEGKNLRQILDQTRKQEKPMPVGVALFIASQIADGLDYAHHSKDFDDAELGLVHRDVSPQNVLIGFSGDIKLCDFGIAKAVSKISTTQMGALKGKLQYMSPEQAWGKAIDHRSDIFSLGTLLYEMLAGERLFTGDSEMAVLESVREADVGAQIIQSPSIPAGVRGLLLRALSKEAGDRFESAAELQHGLEELLKQESPAPGPKLVSAFVHDLLGMQSEPAEAPDNAAVAAVEVTEEVNEDLEWNPIAGEDDLAESDEKSRWLRRLLTRLLPVILVVAIGGGIVASLMQRDPEPSSEVPVRVPVTSLQTAPTTEPPLVNEEPAAVDPQGQPPPRETAAAPTPASSPQPTPRNTQPTTIPEAIPPASDEPPASTPSSSTELDRRVEEELQRVQELMTAPVESAAAGTLDPSPEADTVGNEAQSTPTTNEADVDSFRLESLWNEVLPESAQAEPAPLPIVERGPGVVEPRIIDFEQPAYTPAAEQAGIEGTVRVSVLVDENGQAAQVKLIEGLPEKLGLEEAVIESARQAVYQPATKDDVPARMWFEIAVLFELP